MTRSEILEAYPYLELEDIQACLNYAAFLVIEKLEEDYGEPIFKNRLGDPN